MKKQRGFSLVELMVVISIIVILISFLLPVLSGNSSWRHTPHCMEHMRALSEGHLMYALDKDRKFPSQLAYLHDEAWPGGWPKVIPELPSKSALVKGEYIEDTHAFLCPADDGVRKDRQDLTGAYAYIRPATFSYTRNAHEAIGIPYKRLNSMDKTALLIEEWEFSPMNDGIFWANAYDFITQRHGGFGNMSFYDGHVEPIDGKFYNAQSAAWRINNYLRPPQ